jgi:hypothetical protein
MDRILLKSVRSDGRVFNYESDAWGIHSLSGVDFPEIEIFKENKGQGNGVIVTGKRKKEREIDIVARLRKKANNAVDRDQVLGFHNSNYKFDLYITYLGTTRIAKNCELTAAKYPTENVFRRSELTVMYMSTEADLFASENVTEKMTEETALWIWDRDYDGADGSLIFDTIDDIKTKTIEYVGSESAPITVTVKAKGYSKTIEITVNGSLFKIDTAMNAGDVLVVDASSFTAKLNGVNVAAGNITGSYYDLFFDFGDNTFAIDAAEGGAFETAIDFTGRYGGI